MDALMLPVSAATLWTATQMVVGYLLAMFVGARLLPGIERLGYPQPNGARAHYELTGMTLFFITHLVVAIATFGFGISLAPILTHFWSIFIVINLIACAVSVALFLWGRRSGQVLRSEVGDDLPLPSWLKELWFGNELNPRWLGVDIKMFMYQPSLIGVYLVVLSFAYAQHELYGSVTPQMWCWLFFWWAYLFSHYVKEEFMLSTWDVIAENFGFMLVWGDLVYVPFLYSLPGWWILHHREPFSAAEWGALTLFHLATLYVFREANWQKERYKRDKDAPIWG
jgi:delta14-sterol reductase